MFLKYTSSDAGPAHIKKNLKINVNLIITMKQINALGIKKLCFM